MERFQYDAIAELEKNNWWYTAKRELFEKFIQKYCAECGKALDIGCGTGTNMEILSKHCVSVIGIDPSQDALNYCEQKKLNVVKGTINKIPFPDNTFDIVLCSDVLEHVNDKTAVKEIQRVLKPRGYLMLSVPAFDFLWNDNDDISHHKRRYTKKKVEKLLNDFKIKKLTYWNAALLFPATIIARKQKLIPSKEKKNNLSLVPTILNNILKKWFKIENQLALKLKIPLGVSIIAVAQKHE